MRILDGNIEEKVREELERLIASGVTPYRIWQGSGVNTVTIDRFRKGKTMTYRQGDKLLEWMKTIKK